MNSKIKIGSLFAGVGGIELGFLSQKNCQISWAVENDKHAQITYKENFKHKLIEDDIEKVKQILEDENIHHEAVGIAQKKFFEVENEIKLSVEELYNLNNKWYYNY